MWVEWLNKPLMFRLTLAEQGTYWRLYALAQQCNANGCLVTGSGAPLDLEEIANYLRITSAADREVFDSMLKKMGREQEVIWEDGTLRIMSYEEAQSRLPSNDKARVAERQRLHRNLATKKESSKEPPPPPTPNKDVYIYTEAEEKIRDKFVTEKTHIQSRNSPPSRKIRDSLIAELSKLYEEYIGILTPNAADQLREFAEHYKGDIEWIRKAFDSAGNKRRWPYIAAILERYQEEGGPSGKELDRQSRRGEDESRAAPAINRPDPLEATRQAGWKVRRSGPGETGGGEDNG